MWLWASSGFYWQLSHRLFLKNHIDLLQWRDHLHLGKSLFSTTYERHCGYLFLWHICGFSNLVNTCCINIPGSWRLKNKNALICSFEIMATLPSHHSSKQVLMEPGPSGKLQWDEVCTGSNACFATSRIQLDGYLENGHCLLKTWTLPGFQGLEGADPFPLPSLPSPTPSHSRQML